MYPSELLCVNFTQQPASFTGDLGNTRTSSRRSYNAPWHWLSSHHFSCASGEWAGELIGVCFVTAFSVAPILYQENERLVLIFHQRPGRIYIRIRPHVFHGTAQYGLWAGIYI